jgi:hypothetical protein
MMPHIPTSSARTHVKGCGCFCGGRGRTSHLPVAVSGHYIHRHHQFLKKPVKTTYLGQCINTIPICCPSEQYRTYVHVSFLWSTIVVVWALRLHWWDQGEAPLQILWLTSSYLSTLIVQEITGTTKLLKCTLICMQLFVLSFSQQPNLKSIMMYYFLWLQAVFALTSQTNKSLTLKWYYSTAVNIITNKRCIMQFFG